MSGPGRINLHIERLVLDGLPAHADHAAAIRAAMEVELTRLFAEDRAAAGPRTGAAVPHLQGTAVTAYAAEPPQRFGAAIAKSVHGAIAR